jgi:elongation factor Ts
MMLELTYETHFVAKISEFKQLARDIWMHIAAANPLYIARQDIPADIVPNEKKLRPPKHLANRNALIVCWNKHLSKIKKRQQMVIFHPKL